MIEHLTQALSSLSAAISIGKSIIGLKISIEVDSKIMELTGEIIKANCFIIESQNTQSSLIAKVNELEKECMRLKDWVEEKKHYTRKEIASGVFAYIMNNFEGSFENAHKYCCNCMEKTIPSTLQQGLALKEKGLGRLKTLVCPNGCPNLEFRNYIDQN